LRLGTWPALFGNVKLGKFVPYQVSASYLEDNGTMSNILLQHRCFRDVGQPPLIKDDTHLMGTGRPMSHDGFADERVPQSPTAHCLSKHIDDCH